MNEFVKNLYTPTMKKLTAGNLTKAELEQFIEDMNGPTGKAYIAEDINRKGPILKNPSVKDGDKTLTYSITYENDEFKIAETN